MSLIDRIRAWFGGGNEGHGEMSEAPFSGGAAGGGLGGRGSEADQMLPDDDRGAEGGPPSHDDPLDPQVR